MKFRARLCIACCLLPIAYCLFTSFHPATERLVFDMILWGDKIGNMTIERTQRADSTTLFILETNTEATFMWVKRKGYTRYEVVYKNGQLISSKHREEENAKVQRWTNVRYDGHLYQVDGYKGKRSFSEAPTYSITSIYFQPPKNGQRIFYEAEGTFANMRQTAPGDFEFKSSDGNRNVYYYRSGSIHSMEFHVSVATVYTKRTL